MATTKEVVELLFDSKYNDAGTRALKRDLTNLGGSAQKGVSAVAGFTVALGAMELAALAASIGLAKAGAEAAGSFGAGFNEISTLVTATDADLVSFKNSIKEYAAGSTASLEDINGAIYNAISAGVDYKDSIAFLTEAEKLSVAGKTDLNSAVQILSGTLNAYGAETDQAGKYSDILFSTVKNGVTTIPELVSSLGQVTGTAAAMGISFEEVSAATSTMTKNGIGTAQSMTILKAVINGIINPTKEAQDIADKLGISLGVNALESKGLSGVLQEMTEKTGGSKEQMAKLFSSTEALNGALSLTSKDGLKTFNEDLESATGSAGETEIAFEKMADNVALVKQTLANGIQLTLIGIGEPILDEFADIDKAITSIFQSLRNNLTGSDGALVPVIDSVEQVAATVADIINSIATNMDEALNQADISGFTGAFDSINDALEGLNLTDPKGLANAIGAIGDAFNGLTKFSISAVEVVADLVEIFGNLAANLADMDGDTLKLAGTIGGWAVALSAASLVLAPFVALIFLLAKTGGVIGGFGSAAGIGALSTAVRGLGTAGALAAAGWAGFKIGEMAVEAIDNVTGLTDALYGAEKPTKALQQAMDDYAQSIGKTTVTTQEYIDAMKAKHNGLTTTRQALVDGKIVQEELNLAQASGVTELKATFTEEEKLRAARTNALWELDEITGEVVKNQQAYDDVVKSQAQNTKELGAATKDSKKALTDLSQSTKPAADDMKNLGMVSDSTKNSIDSLSAIKPAFDFQIAKVESEAKQIESIMDALAISAKQSGESMGSALGILGSDNYNDLGLFEQDAVLDSIQEMSKIQTEVAQAEIEISKAKADYMNAQVASMQNGDAMIKIDGTGLEPELNAFMFAVLKGIQGKVASNQADFLLGMPT